MEKTKKIKNLDLWIILAAVTLCAAVAAILLIVKPGEIKEVEDIKVITTEQSKVLNANETKRFVIVYDSSSVDNELLLQTAVRYAEYTRKNKKAPKLYLIDTQTNSTIITDLEESKVSPRKAPCLLTITPNNSTTKITSTANVPDICNQLEDYISGKVS